MIIAQALVVGYVVVNEFDPRTAIREYPLNPDVPMQMIGIVCPVAALFLLVASPFFFRRLRLIAWSGFVIALAFFLYPFLNPR